MCATEPPSEEDIEIAVTVGRTGVTSTGTSIDSGRVRLVWRIAIKGSSGTIFDPNFATTTAFIGMVSDINTAGLLWIDVVTMI